LVFFHIKAYKGSLEETVAEGIIGFETYDKAMGQALQRLPSEMFTAGGALTAGDVAMATVTIVSALGLAWVVDMQSRNAFEPIQRDIRELEQGLENLNITALMEQVDEIKEEMKHIKSFQEEDDFIAKELLDFLPISEQEAVFSSKVLGRVFENYFPHILEVGAETPRYQRWDEWYDMWKFWLGFKDGFVHVTGPNSWFA